MQFTEYLHNLLCLAFTYFFVASTRLAVVCFLSSFVCMVDLKYIHENQLLCQEQLPPCCEY